MELNTSLIVGFIIASLIWTLKDIIQNFIIGLFIYLHPSIKRKDYIVVKSVGVEGTIKQIGIKWTQIESPEGVYLVENRKIFDSVLLKK